MQDYSEDGYSYRLLKLIGKGAYGAVYLAEVEDGSNVAVKHIVNAFTGSTDARRIFREIAVMRHFSHPNIIRLRAILTPRDQAGFTAMWLVSDLMETDLHRVIHSRQDLTSDHISYFIYQLLCALQHLHSAGVLHRDLKPSNLLVNADCSLTVCDFGLARETDATLSVALTEYVVTRWYRAPEVLLSGGRYTGAIDVWAAGCILAELLLRRPIFPGENYLHQLQLILKTLGTPTEEQLHFVHTEAARQFITRQPYSAGVPLPSLLPHVRGPCLDLLARMLVFDPAQRITVDECLAHPFLARVRAARASVSEIGPSRKFHVPLRLRGLGVDVIRRAFIKTLCFNGSHAMERARSMGADHEYDSLSDALAGTDSSCDDTPCSSEEEDMDGSPAGGAGFMNGRDAGIDSQSNEQYWAKAGRHLQSAAEAGHREPAQLAEYMSRLGDDVQHVPGDASGAAAVFHTHREVGHAYDALETPVFPSDPAVLADMAAMSPMRHASKVRARTLMAIGGSDRRVPASQGLLWVHELRRLGKAPVRMMWYGDDTHALDTAATVADILVHTNVTMLAELR